jgi:prepilin-type N-terminal cleavage/methylation domain-containing protein
MLRKKGFTLVELLVVISIIALLVSILMPSLNKAKEIAFRMKCGTNQNAVGKSLALYRNLNNDSYPMNQDPNAVGQVHASSYPRQWIGDWGRPGSTAVFTGFRREKKPTINEFYCITSLMWMLVRADTNPKLFTCPSDGDVIAQPEDKKKYFDPDENEDVYCWDFSDHKNVSYSYQSVRLGIIWPGQMVILADKTPVYSLGASGTYLEGWSDTLSEVNKRLNMSQNHKGEEINVLRADSSVHRDRRADINDLTTPKDCIYTWWNSEIDARSSTQVDPSAQQIGPIYLITEGAKDSMLHGPYKGP